MKIGNQRKRINIEDVGMIQIDMLANARTSRNWEQRRVGNGSQRLLLKN